MDKVMITFFICIAILGSVAMIANKYTEAIKLNHEIVQTCEKVFSLSKKEEQ